MGVSRNSHTEASRSGEGVHLGREAEKRKKQGRWDSSQQHPPDGVFGLFSTERLHFMDGQGRLRPSMSRHHIS